MGKIAQIYNCHPFAILKMIRKCGIKSRSLSEAMSKVRIPPKKLKILYEKKKLSTASIAKMYNCSHATILNKMKIYRIKTRSRLGMRKSLNIPKETLRKFYKKQKISQEKIAKKFKCSIWGIQQKMKEYQIKSRSLSEAGMKYPKRDFNGDLKERAYLIGFRLGDLHVSRKKLQIHMGCSTTVSEQVELIKNLFSQYTYVYIKPSRILNGKQVIDIQCLLNNSFNFLLKKEDRIEDWILTNDDYFFAFLAGYIDAEGASSSNLNKKFGKTPYVILEIQSYDKNILKQIWEKLNSLAIFSPKPKINKPKGYISKSLYSIGYTNSKNLWRLAVNRKDALLMLFNKIEPFIKHLKRKEKLSRGKKNLLLRDKFAISTQVRLDKVAF